MAETNMPPTSDIPSIALWGASGAGKSCWLAAALLSDPPPQVDLPASAEALAGALGPLWEAHRSGRPVPPTHTPAEIALTLASGHTVRLVDLPGSTHLGPAAAERLRSATGVLLVHPWGAPPPAALDAAWQASRSGHCGLVLTGLERSLPEESPAWERPPGWWRASTWGQDNEGALARFGAAVWPTSAMGYDTVCGTPALLLGDFGQLVPSAIRPRGVGAPLAWMLERLEDSST